MSRQGPDAVSGRGERETPGTADAEASCRDRGRRVDLSVRAGGLSPEGEGRVSQRTTWVCAVRSYVFSSKKENTVDSAHLSDSHVDVQSRNWGRLISSVHT